MPDKHSRGLFSPELIPFGPTFRVYLRVSDLAQTFLIQAAGGDDSMMGKLRYLLLPILFIGLTCGLTGASAQTGGDRVPVGDISELAGKWVWGQLGTKIWSYTGSYADPNGSRITYQFSPDGAVQYTGFTQFTTGSCSRTVTQLKKGRASLSGDTLTIKWGRGFLKEELVCERASNQTKTTSAETETLKVVFKNSSDGRRQLCTGLKVAETCSNLPE